MILLFIASILALLKPKSIVLRRWHYGDGAGFDFDASSGTYAATDGYLLDSACLWRSVHTDASGGFVWFKTDGSSAIGIDTLRILARDDAQVTDTTSGGVLSQASHLSHLHPITNHTERDTTLQQPPPRMERPH